MQRVTYVYVVVDFLSQVIFIFLLFLGMLMYADEVKKKENRIAWDKKLSTTCTFGFIDGPVSM